MKEASFLPTCQQQFVSQIFLLQSEIYNHKHVAYFGTLCVNVTSMQEQGPHETRALKYIKYLHHLHEQYWAKEKSQRFPVHSYDQLHCSVEQNISTFFIRQITNQVAMETGILVIQL